MHINYVRAHGFDVHPQVGVAGYFLDLAVVDPKRPGRYILAVECDGATYHSAKSARDRDRLRQGVLDDRFRDRLLGQGGDQRGGAQ